MEVAADEDVAVEAAALVALVSETVAASDAAAEVSEDASDAVDAVDASESEPLAGASTDVLEALSAVLESPLFAAAYAQVVIAMVAVNARTAVKILFFIIISSKYVTIYLLFCLFLFLYVK